MEELRNERGYTYSYSGADCRAYCWFPDRINFVYSLKSLATISLSVHEAKSPVRRLGNRGVSGFTESIRTIAGSMVFTIIEDHPLKDLLNMHYVDAEMPASIDERSIYSATSLEPINILLKYKTEVDSAKGAGTSIEIMGLRFVNEGEVTSVNDMVTEMIVQFIAEDVKIFDMERDRVFVNYKNPKITPKRKFKELKPEEVTLQKAKEAIEPIAWTETEESMMGPPFLGIEEPNKQKPIPPVKKFGPALSDRYIDPADYLKKKVNLNAVFFRTKC